MLRGFRPVSTPHLSAPLIRRLSAERFRPYVAAAGGDVAQALRLYEWNTAVSGAFFESLGALEVLLRNALHEELAALHAAAGLPGRWYDDPRQVLTPRARQDIAQARQRLAQAGRPATPGRVVAELSFGFWRFLLARRHEHTLWTPALRKAFPLLRPARRALVHDPLERLHLLRNRIAHHEPVHRRNLRRDYLEMTFVAGAICADTAHWIARTSRVTAVLARRPM